MFFSMVIVTNVKSSLATESARLNPLHEVRSSLVYISFCRCYLATKSYVIKYDLPIVDDI